MDLELVSEHENYYLARNEQGEEIKLFKIKTKELEESMRRDNLKVVEKLNFKRLNRLVEMLEVIDKSDILIEHYEGTVTRLVEHLKVCYDEVGRPNLFHYYIKNLDPIHYGRAQTFREETRRLIERVHEIVELKKELK